MGPRGGLDRALKVDVIAFFDVGSIQTGAQGKRRFRCVWKYEKNHEYVSWSRRRQKKPNHKQLVDARMHATSSSCIQDFPRESKSLGTFMENRRKLDH